MAGSELLSNILDYDELITLSEPIVAKIETHLKAQSKEISDLKVNSERLRVNNEQQFFEIEKQLVEAKNQLQTESEKATKYSEELKELEEKFDSVSKKLRTLENSEEDTLSTQLKLRRSNEHLEAEKRDLAVLLEKKTKEIDWLSEENKALGDKLAAANTAKCELLAQVEDVHNQDVMTKYREKRLEQENQMLQQQYDWMKSEVDKKSQDLINYKKEQASKILELQGSLEEKTQEVFCHQELVESLRGEKEALAKRLTDITEKLKDTKESNAQCEEQFRLELQSQKKLAILYKESCEEAETKSEEFCRATEELRKIVFEASQSYEELELRLKETEDKHEMDLNDKDKRISDLEQELETANALMRTAKLKGLEITEEGIEALSPAAAAASKLLKSGMTLTQIYNEYVQNYDALEAEKEENGKLNQYINQIIQEIEEKAPLLKKQREDYETSLQSISQLTRQLDLAMLECEKTRSEADECRRKSNHYQRESQKFKQQNQDLSQQVCYLLKEVEELRGGRVVREDISSSDVSSSSHIISERLINFRNVQELQEQNQNLLATVRELSEKSEEEEKQATDSRISELKEQLNTALEEMEEFKASRMRQMEMVESIIRQRDMYRVLLAQTGTSPSLLQGSVSPGIPITPTNLKSPGIDQQAKLEEMKTALTELKSEYETYKREKAENEKVINEQLDVQRTEASSLRLQNAKLSAQLDIATERFKILQSNADSFKKEIASHREKNQKYTTLIMKHEMTVNSLKQELMTKQELMSRLEVQCENLRAEKELLKTAEARLVQEHQNLRREQSSQNILMTSLQTIQNNLERAEYETKAKLGQQVEQLEKECSGLRRKLDTERDQQTAATRHWESQVRELHSQLDGELTKHQSTREQLANMSKQVLQLQQQLSEKEAKLSAVQSRLGQGVSGVERGDGESDDSHVAINEQVKDLKSQLQQSQAEVKALRNQLQKANEHTSQYKDIAQSIENGLKEQNEVSKQFQETLEAKLKEVEQQKKNLDEQMQNVDKEKQDLINENIRLSEESHKLNGELRKQLSNLQHELEEAIERREVAIKVEQTSREDSLNQAKIAAEAQDKYERELMLHAADVEALTAIKKELEGFTSKLEELRDEKNKAVSQLEMSKSSWTEQEGLLKEEIKKLEGRCAEITNQNSVLHEQMSKLSTQVVSIQESALTSPAKTPTSLASSTDSEKSTEQLLEVIRFIRREKDIAETKVEVIQSETNRLTQQTSQLERQLKDVSASLAEERERSQVSVHTANQHAELMKKVENHNLLTDSNKLLREEKERYLQQLRELEVKTKSLEEQIAPLQKSNRELQAQYDSLNAEKAGLQGEVDRWKNRTNHLIEQCNKADPEEQNRLIQERDNLRKQMSTLTESVHKLRAENSRLTARLQASQKEVFTGKQESGNLNQTVEKLKSDLAAKSSEVDEKNVTVTQLKKIGRKYKEQAEMAVKEKDETISQLNQLKEQQQQQAVSNTSNDEAMSALKEKLQEIEKERDELKSRLEERDAEITSLKEKLEKLQAELNQSNESSQKLKTDMAEMEKKQNQSRTMIQSARKQMASHKTDVEKLMNENSGLKEKVKNLQSEKDKVQTDLSSHQKESGDKITQLEQQLEKTKQSDGSSSEDKETAEQLQKDNTELRARVHQLQKMIESLQKGTGKKSLPQRPQVKSPAERISASTEAPRTANIRPMATPSAGIRPATPIQPVASGSAATKATASIRPMAITPTPGSHQGPTPTATVMPTTVSPQDTHEEAAPTSLPTGTVQGRPAQRVAPQVEIQATELPTVVPEATDISPAPSVSEPQPSTSTETSQTTKRPREVESYESEPEGKKSRVMDTVVLPTITVTDEETHTTTTLEGQTDEDLVEEAAPDEAPTDNNDMEDESSIPVSQTQCEIQEVGEGEGQGDDDEVILVESDEEEGDEGEDDEMEGEESGEDDGEMEEEEYEEVEVEEEYEEEEDGETDDEEGRQDEEEDDIVILEHEGDEEIDGEVQDETEAVQEEAPQTSQGQRPPPPLQPIVPPERLPSSNSRNQLAPFMFGGQSGGFEDGDDCTVPSTPTLYVPRRGDGFAEAISSPHVPQRFVFGSGMDSAQNQPELAQLGSQGALGMDDTRMDLSQFDDGSSRPGTSQSAALLAPDDSPSVETIPSETVMSVLSADSSTDQGEVTVVEREMGEISDSTSQQDASHASPSVETVEEIAEGGVEGQEEQTTDQHDAAASPGQQCEQEGETINEAGTDQSAVGSQPERPGSAGSNRPRIQRIVWDDGSIHSTPQQSISPSGPMIRPPLGRGRAGRGNRGVFTRGRMATRGFRSHRPRRGF